MIVAYEAFELYFPSQNRIVILQDLARFLQNKRPDHASCKINVVCKSLARSCKIKVICKSLARSYKITAGVCLGFKDIFIAHFCTSKKVNLESLVEKKTDCREPQKRRPTCQKLRTIIFWC